MSNDFFDIVETDIDVRKKEIIEHMNFLKSMSVEESTFYKKHLEVQSYTKHIGNASITKAKLWLPDDLSDESKTIKQIENINPRVIYVDGKELEMDWLMIRIFGHTMEFSQTPGRFLKFLIDDGNGKYLGCLSISSDIIAIGERDKYIGWSSDNKLKNNKRINNSAICSCIMSTQPFGYNFLGGKLMASLATSSVIRDKWKELYNNILVGMTTTSLYGKYSMYDRLPWWKACGESAGKVPIRPDENYYKEWHEYVKEHYAKKYEEMMTQKEGVGGPVTGAKNRVMNLIFKELGIKTSEYEHGYARGVYYSCFYDNTKEFLCDKIQETDLKMKQLFIDDKKSILDWWKVKAINRYTTLKKDNRIKPEVLFYNQMIGMTYDDAKKKYFNEVGR
jgi:hypothetical protein